MFLDAPFLIGILVLVLVVFVIIKWKSSGQGQPPSLPCLPLVGSLPFLQCGNVFEFFMEKSSQLGPIFTFRAGNKLVLTLNSKEVINAALSDNPGAFASRPNLEVIHGITPNYTGITFSETSADRTRVIKNVSSVLRDLGFGVQNKMEEIVQREVHAMTEFAKENGGKLLESDRFAFGVTSNVVMDMLFGSKRRDYNMQMLDLYLQLAQFGASLDVSCDVAPLLKFLPKYRDRLSVMKTCTEKIQSHLDNLMKEHFQDPEKNTFIQKFIEKEGPCYDRQQLLFLLRDIIFGGATAIGVLLQWTLVALANHPEVQKKIQDEIDSKVPRDRLPSMEDQSQLHFVEATMLEVFRWRTILPLGIPRFTMTDCRLKDYSIPAGTLVLTNQYAANNDPKVWSDPKAFNPERFLDKENNIINKFQVTQFGAGQRGCFGQVFVRAEFFLILSSLLQKFTIELPEEVTKANDDPVQPVEVVTLPRPFSFKLAERR